MRKDEHYQNTEMTKISGLAKEVFVSRRDVSSMLNDIMINLFYCVDLQEASGSSIH